MSAIAMALIVSSPAHAAQPAAFAIRCTTSEQAMADQIAAGLGKAVQSKKNILSSGQSDPAFEDRKKTAIAALRSASVVVFGHDPKYDEYHAWILALQNKPGFWNDDFDFTQGVTFLKACLQTFAGETFMGHNGQVQTIDAAFWRAYGRPANAAERNAYLPEIAAGKAWYATIVFAEKQKIAAAGTPEPKRGRDRDRAQPSRIRGKP